MQPGRDYSRADLLAATDISKADWTRSGSSRELRAIVGNEYNQLTELERIVLVLAHRFGEVTNENIQHYRHEHPREIGECLRGLTQKGWLKSSGHGKGTRYQLGGREPDLFTASSEHYEDSSEHYEDSSEHYRRLFDIAAPVRKKGRASKTLVEKTILALCTDDFISLRTLAELLNREPDSVRNHYVGPMVKHGILEPRFPGHPNHPQQGYRTRR
jgi:ATP-dependent DNA helicase RecG